MQQRSFTVPNISCSHCTATIVRELEQLDGVGQAEADATSKRVRVQWQAPATWEEIHSLLAEIGFPPADA